MGRSSEKQIARLRQILFWPLQYRPPKGRKRGKHVAELLEAGGWARLPDLISRDNRDDALAYAEFVYFHPFVQKFLYGKETALQLYCRTDIRQARVVLQHESPPPAVQLDVDRVQLYHFEDMDIFILLVEVSTEAPLSLKDGEDLLDQFRRAYPPYWEEGKAGHCPALVTFGDSEGAILATSDYGKAEEHQRFLRQHGQPPVAEHWRFLAAPLSLDSGGEAAGGIPCRHVLDDRMPHMAWLAFEDPAALSEWDMVRLGLAEDSGESHKSPYAAAFLESAFPNHCYDRYWRKVNANHESTAEKEESVEPPWLTTRYLASDYSFTVIGTYDCRGENFFCDAAAGLLSHFRRHYCQMFLVAIFYRATLLAISDRLAASVFCLAEQDNRGKDRCYGIIQSRQLQLLTFTHRYWFTDISNQVQGRELFRLLLRHQEIEQLFAKVNRESHELYEFLETRFQHSESEQVTRLTVVATVGLVLGLAFGYFDVSQKLNWNVFGQVWVVLCGVFLAVIFLSKPICSVFDYISRLFDNDHP